MLDSSFGNLRKYSPILFKNLEFHPSNNSTALIKAVNVIKDMSDHNKRKIPDDAPIEFISKRWKNHVCNEDGTTSSSDGMRVEVGVSSIYADKNPHYGIGKGFDILA
ncbi:Tn3 family transposase [Clostridium estertheticum]|nr:Tn3 family transposase [Clostridium estertheticum]MBU3178523.1 Tn3 family transposase [Clostridium estertheticum]